MGIPLFLLLATLLSTSRARFVADNPIKLPGQRSAAVSKNSTKINCQSFRVGVEAYNLRDWDTIPSYCKSYIKTYVEKKQYGLDIEAVVGAAIKYAESINIDDFTDVWIFDVDETLLSNLGYFAGPDSEYGTKPLNTTSFYEWLKSGNATALPAIPDLYDAVFSLGFKIVLISSAPEGFRGERISNLENVGYYGWHELFLKGPADGRKTAQQYKSDRRTELVKQGYRIVGNVGDQWSDLTGENVGVRTFKVPNPIYYVV